VSSKHAAVGGPNLPPAGDGLMAECVAAAPGGPSHVLLTDREAEHLPGCNLAIRADVLRSIGGFDPQFRSAGDDVDVCWRLQQQGETLGFHPAAVVWHHRRTSARAYWKQQRGYGTAEALLERKWPAKYNSLGHPIWAGRLYGGAIPRTFDWRPARVYQGTWGSAPYAYAAVDSSPLAGLEGLPLSPEWPVVASVLCLVGLFGVAWRPLLGAGVLG